MSIVHYAAPYAPPTPKVSPWSTLEHQWTGWDGSVWALSDHRQGVFLIRESVRGMHFPAHDRYVATSPALAGARSLGSRVLQREAFWPLHIYSDLGSEDWIALDRAFWASMHRDKPGVWRVRAPGGSWRELSCYLMEAEDGFEADPVHRGWNTYGVRLIADDPFWRGPWVVRQFDNATTDGDFFNGGAAPPFFISSSSQTSQARIDNPGDEASYLVYVLHGPFDSAEVGIGSPGPKTQYLAPVAAGSSVVIDTRPSSPTTAKLIPTPTADPGTVEWEAQVFGIAGTSAFDSTGTLAMNSPLQPGQERPLTVSMVGAGSVTVAHRPPYWRAF